MIADRIRETTTTAGTGTVTLAGAAAGYAAFSSAFQTGVSVPYLIVDGTAWEIGVGVYTTSGTTLSRLVVYASSNSNALVSLSGGTSYVMCTMPSRRIAQRGLVARFAMGRVLR